MRVLFFMVCIGCWMVAITASGQKPMLDWQVHQFNDYAVTNAFPLPANTEDIEIDHPYARKETATCFDPVTKSTYRLTIVHHAGIYEWSPTETFFKNVASIWKDQDEHEFLRTDFVSIKERKAIRIISKHEKEGFSIWQISKTGANLYVHEVISKTGDFDKTTVDQFVESLEVDDPGEPQYFRMMDTVAAITYDIPARPEAKRRTFDASQFGLNRQVVVNSFLLTDEYQGVNYVVLFRDNPAGIVYDQIDTTLNEYQIAYEQQFNRKAKQARRLLIDGYHTLELSFELSQSEVEMAIIMRGNRAYVIMVEQVSGGSGLQQKKEQFFSSMKFLPFIHMEREAYKIRDSLYIDLPTRPLKDTTLLNTYPYECSYSLYALDSMSGVSYTFDDYQLSPYFWTSNYDSLLQADYDSLMTTSLVIKAADTLFQGERAQYVVYQEEDTDIYLYELFFYRGPHYFNLIVIGSREYTEEMAWDYFRSFRFDRAKYIDDYIAVDKTKPLWEAMESRDSTTLRQAKYALNNRTIKTPELPKVYDFLERDLEWDTITYPQIRELMFDKLVELHLPESIFFLEKLYQKSPSDTLFRKNILEALVRFRTAEALASFFPLAKDFDPLNTKGIEYWQGFRDLSDTLQLAATKMDDWLSLVQHRSLRYYALDLIDDMLKDSLVRPERIVPVVDQLISEGRRIIEDYKLIDNDTITVKGEIYDLRKINEVLAKLPSTEHILTFVEEQFAFRQSSFLRTAVQTSLSLKHLPPDSILNKIYQESPSDWYLILQTADESGMIGQLPAEFCTQRELVRAYMYNVLEYDWGAIADMSITDQRPMSKAGDKYQVYIVKYRQASSEGFKYGLCTQPEDIDVLRFPPDFYDYTYDEDVAEKDQIKSLLERFVEWEKE